jgi:hypothetical protein
MTLFQAMNTGHTTYSTMHADSVRTVINRLENEPINVPRQMVRSLDVLCVQGFASVSGKRVRRTRRIAEIEGIDERTGELDYSTAFEWHPEGDTHVEQGSSVAKAIREERGWSQTDLLRELKRRWEFIKSLRENGVDDYRRFTAAVKAYYADPERAVVDVERAARPDDSGLTIRKTADSVANTGKETTDEASPDGAADDGIADDEATDDGTAARATTVSRASTRWASRSSVRSTGCATRSWANSTPRPSVSIAISPTARPSPTPSRGSTNACEPRASRAWWPSCETRCARAATSRRCCGSPPERPKSGGLENRSVARRWRRTS